MKGLNTIVFPLVREQNVLKPLPDPLAVTLMPHWNINILDLIDSDQPRAKVVKAETTLDKVGPIFHILNSQWDPESPKAAL